MSVTQSDFRAALLNNDLAAPTGLKDANGVPAGRRFDVYRNNVAVSLTEALETGFPAIAKLLGEENFKAIAGVYLRQSPPSSPLMMYYGASFPAFLRGFEPLKHLGYLGDVADMEMAMRRSYHAADSAEMDDDVLSRIPPENLATAKIELVPSVEIATSPWPIYDIWAFNMIEGAAKPTAGAQDVLIVRRDFDPEPQLMPAGGGAFAVALAAGETLGDAAELATQSTPDFDLSASLALLLTCRAILSTNT
ncbi:DNA-binding domain-containing protein [uncultured Shimia sp.]|uniref:DNA-binding domain-containing protein n=1 Tax=uncultured Shimia sp. TaxID=573152 RepID=UPI002627A55E|nr:DNA-binding domain-containing protein [uncultured Shimia sp.]